MNRPGNLLRISKESIFSDLNNLSVDSVLQMKYPTAFGFTSEEVQKLAGDLGHAGFDFFFVLFIKQLAVFKPVLIKQPERIGCYT